MVRVLAGPGGDRQLTRPRLRDRAPSGVGGWIVLALVGATTLGCAGGVANDGERTRPQRGAPGLTAIPDGEGRVRLDWTPVDSAAEAYVIERQFDGGDWLPLATVPATETTRVDDDGRGRQLRSYRVAAVRKGKRRSWSAVARAVSGYRGLPYYGWLDVSDYYDESGYRERCGPDRETGLHPIQCALNDLGATGGAVMQPPHVLYFPNGTYDVDRTLYLEGRAGVQLVGESPGGVVLRWSDPERTGTGPDDPQVLFHFEGNRDASFRNLIWDGGCDDPRSPDNDCFVVAFDQSFCGVCNGPDGECLPRDERTEPGLCDGLTWPEDKTVGFGDMAGSHFDLSFRNAYIGLRIGHYQVQDDSLTVRRCRFENTFAGASIEDFNALRIWFWDSWFEGNWVGVTNDIQLTRRRFDPGYAPGTCTEPAGRGCFNRLECADGARCEYQRTWAGDFDVLRGRFVDNTHADVLAQPTGVFIVRDSWSVGSGRFFHAAGPNATAASYTLIGNRVESDAGALITSDTPGPFLLVDNRLVNDGRSPAVQLDALAVRGTGADLGKVDVVSVGNRFSSPERFRLGSAPDSPGGRLRSVDDADCGDDCPAVAPPPLPVVTDPFTEGTVASVVEASSIQPILDRALDRDEDAVVHFPALPQRLRFDEPLTLRASAARESSLLVVGDGPWTVLQWMGDDETPMLEVDASSFRRLILRDLQLMHGVTRVIGVRGHHERVLFSQLRSAKAIRSGYALVDLDGVRLDLVDHYAQSAYDGTGTLFKAGGATGEGEALDAAIWTGVATKNDWDVDVVTDRTAGPGGRLLLSGLYMEDSKHYLRMRGPGTPLDVTILGGKLAPIVPLPEPAMDEELARAIATVLADRFPGSFSLLQSNMFVQTVREASHCCPSDVAADAGPRIRVLGDQKLDVQSVGLILRRLADQTPNRSEVDLRGSSRTRYLRVGSKRSVPNAEPLDDVSTEPSTRTRRLDDGELAEPDADRLRQAVESLRKMTMPAYYDEQGREAEYRLSFDNLFFWDPRGIGLVVLGDGPECAGEGLGNGCEPHEACVQGVCLGP